MKTKNWYTSKEISEICKNSTRTIERKRNKLLKLNPDLDWFRMNTKPYKYSYRIMGEFMSPKVFELIKRNRQLSNTIRCLHRTRTLEQQLSFFEWDFFVTISYEDSLSKKKCFSAMSELYDEMVKESCGKEVRMFFTTEPFANRYGYHNHLAIKMSGTLEDIKRFIERYAPIGIVDVQPYDPELAGIFYICKNGRDGVDWDLMGNNLSKENLIDENENHKRAV
jgi:hypothetical protein